MGAALNGKRLKRVDEVCASSVATCCPNALSEAILPAVSARNRHDIGESRATAGSPAPAAHFLGNGCLKGAAGRPLDRLERRNLLGLYSTSPASDRMEGNVTARENSRVYNKRIYQKTFYDILICFLTKLMIVEHHPRLVQAIFVLVEEHRAIAHLSDLGD